MPKPIARREAVDPQAGNFNMNVQALLESRSKIVSDMRLLTDLAATETRDLNDKESSDFDSMRSSLNTLDSSIKRAEILREAERSLPVDPASARRGNDRCP